jgi:hypothetical protein
MNEQTWKQPDDKSNTSAAASSKLAVNQARDVPTGTTVRIKYKHSLAIRWMHWINFPLLFAMIYSDLLIYWADSQHEGLNAHRVYRVGFGSWTLFRFFPTWFYNTLHLKFQLAKGLGYHYGVAYVLYTLFSGEWRELVPTRRSFREAIEVTLHDLRSSKHHPPHRKFNGAQQVANFVPANAVFRATARSPRLGWAVRQFRSRRQDCSAHHYIRTPTCTEHHRCSPRVRIEAGRNAEEHATHLIFSQLTTQYF